MMHYLTIFSFLLSVAFSKEFSSGANAEQSVAIPKSCAGLEDGTYFLKLIDSDDYPIVRAKCSNNYVMIDYEMDNNWEEYFSSFIKYHYSVSGPIRNDLSNWEEWFQPSYLNMDSDIPDRVHTYSRNSKRNLLDDDDDSSSSSDDSDSDSDDSDSDDATAESNNEFIISIDCDVCDESDSYQKEGTSTSWYMSSLAFGCFNPTRGWPSCDMDFYSYECKVCAWNSEGSQIEWTARDFATEEEVSLMSMSDGICDFTLRSHNDDIANSFLQCSAWSASDAWNAYKPSIGMNGQYCQCYKAKESSSLSSESETQVVRVSREEYNLKILELSNGMEKEEVVAPPPLSGEEEMNKNVVHLTQADFQDGTYRITKSGIYLLDEDIVFDFNAGSDDDPFGKEAWWPKEEWNTESLYPGAQDARGSYFLGFFAGVTIETSFVRFDLQGHSMSMSKSFFYSQPFFSIIELASQPFLPQQGPGFFGSDPSFASNTEILNGVLGLTSHHAIHGNYNNEITIHDLIIRDFQTHGIQLNGFQDAIIRNVEIGPSTDIAYLNGNFAHFRQAMSILNSIAEESGDSTISFNGRKDIEYTMQDMLTHLQIEMKKAWDYVNYGIVDKEDFEDSEWYKLFINPSGLSYGAVTYGLFLNYPSAGIFGWHVNDAKSGSVSVENVYIHDLSRKGEEVIGLAKTGRVFCNLFNGPIPLQSMLGSWDIINEYQSYLWDSSFTDTSINYQYVGDIVSDIHIAMYEFGGDDFDNWPGIPYYGDSAELVSWAKGETDAQDLINPSDSSIYPYCNNDAMFHPSKGLLGVKVSGVENAYFSNLKISNLVDLTPMGHNVCGSKDLYHFSQQNPYQIGYCMNMVHAIAADFSLIEMDGVDIEGIYSQNGASFAFTTWFDTTINYLSPMTIVDVHSGYASDDPTLTYLDRPNKADEACAVRVYSSQTYTVKHNGFENGNLNIQCVTGNVGCYGTNDKTNIGQVLNSNQVICKETPVVMNNNNNNNIRVNVHNNNNQNNNHNHHIALAIAIALALIAAFAIYYYHYYSKTSKIKSFKYQKINATNDKYGTFHA